MSRRARAFVMTAVASVGVGATATLAGAQNPGGQNRPLPPFPRTPLVSVTVPANATPQLAEAIRQLNEWRQKGMTPPLPVYDPATGGTVRNPDGSEFLYDGTKNPPPLPPTRGLTGPANRPAG